MISLIDVTMLGALMQVTGNIPDSSLLQILSRYLGRKAESDGAVLNPLEISSRLHRLRAVVLAAAAAAALAAAAASVWATAAGWWWMVMLAITGWTLAANLAVISLVLAAWRRRALHMWDDIKEEVAPGRRDPGPKNERAKTPPHHSQPD